MTTTTSIIENELEPQSMLPQHEAPKRGFTLTEIAIVLGIIGLILGAIWVAAAAVYNNLRVSKANTEILQIVQGIRGLYATAPDATGMTVAALITARVVPNDMINAAGTALIDPWPNGATQIDPTGDNLGFRIRMSAVPQAACISLLTAVAGNNRDPGLTAAAGAAAAQAIPATVGNPLAAPVLPTGTTCAAGAAGNNVQFVFGLKS